MLGLKERRVKNLENYFVKFPIIKYNNTVTRDITERVALINRKKTPAGSIYPIELGDQTRSDIAAWKIYNDPTLDWMLYLSNNILDPYYEWHLSDDDFIAFIKTKYGSIELSKEKVAYYRLIWPEENSHIPVGYYNSLPEVYKKYFDIVLGAKNKIIAYTRKTDQDWIMNTNKILRWDVTMDTANTSFSRDDIIEVMQFGNVIGKAEVITANDSILVVQHVQDNSSPNLIRSFSDHNLTGTITDTDTITENITEIEAAYWEPLFYYDLEVELNEQRRYIDIVDPAAVLQISDIIRRELASKVTAP